MTFTMKIEGMMCPHCEARVKSIIEGVEGVSEAVVSHKDGTAVVKADESLFEHIKTLVEKEGYKVGR